MAFASKSPWVIHYDGSSCNGCDIEVLAALCPGYNVLGGVDSVIPVDVYAPGCAVRPETIIDAVVQGVAVLDEKSKALKKKRKEAAL